VTVNNVPAVRIGGTPQNGTWRVNVPVMLPVPAGGALRFDARAVDGRSNAGLRTLVVDNDGIPGAIDRGRVDSADHSAHYSDEFNNGRTAGTLFRTGWTTQLSTTSTVPNGVRATISGAGGLMRLSACTGAAKEVRFDVTGETADVACDPVTGTITVRVISGRPTIDVMKQVSPTTWTRTPVPTGQTYSTGSPLTADPANTQPITTTLVEFGADGTERVIGTITLNPGESADLQVVQGGPGIDPQLHVTALRGTVRVTLSGRNFTVAPGRPLTIPMTIPGRMHGNGFIRADGVRYQFVFEAAERVGGAERGHFDLRVEEERPASGRGPRRLRLDRFVAREVSSVTFSDDPTVWPGRRRRPQVDTVAFSGTGTWNGIAGYRFEIGASDHGEPGRHRETIAITIWDSGGSVVVEVEGTIDGGNVQSSRIRH
jgi:hypothetical protein